MVHRARIGLFWRKSTVVHGVHVGALSSDSLVLQICFSWDSGLADRNLFAIMFLSNSYYLPVSSVFCLHSSNLLQNLTLLFYFTITFQSLSRLALNLGETWSRTLCSGPNATALVSQLSGKNYQGRQKWRLGCLEFFSLYLVPSPHQSWELLSQLDECFHNFFKYVYFY